MDAFNDFITVLSSDTCRILDLFFRLVINTVFTLIIARNFYFPKARRRDFFFAIFCIMRYRTESVPIREMTYLFLVIALSAINGLAWAADISPKHPEFMGPLMTSMGELIVTDLLFVVGVWIAEANKLVKSLSTKYVKYDKIDLIKPDRREELIADLKERTGLDVTNVSIGSIDFLKDMALIKIYYNTDGCDENTQKMPKDYE